MAETANVLVHQAVLFCFFGLLAWAAVSDFREYLIPNRVCLAIAGLYPAHVVASATPVDWPIAIVVALAALVAGFALFAGKLVGGGDAKLLSAVALWAGPDLVLGFVLVTSLFGGILSIAMLKFMWAARPREAGGARLSHFKVQVPYGIAIVAGGAYVGARLFAVVAG